MEKPRVYIETTIPSYLVARPNNNPLIAVHQQLTTEWWENERSNYELFVSDVVVDEVSVGEPAMANARLDSIRDLPRLVAGEFAIGVAGDLLKSGIIPMKAKADALHIAIALQNRMDFLLTWNCKHINNANTKRRMQSWLLTNYHAELPMICTPEELMQFNP